MQSSLEISPNIFFSMLKVVPSLSDCQKLFLLKKPSVLAKSSFHTKIYFSLDITTDIRGLHFIQFTYFKSCKRTGGNQDQRER